jgi:hypothetical protein
MPSSRNSYSNFFAFSYRKRLTIASKPDILIEYSIRRPPTWLIQTKNASDT